MKISVTEQDIANGLPLNAQRCAVACALQREGCEHVFVSAGSMSWIQNNQLCRVAYEGIPNPLKHFIRDFDRWGRRGVNPATFEVETSCEVYSFVPV